MICTYTTMPDIGGGLARIPFELNVYITLTGREVNIMSELLCEFGLQTHDL